MKNRVFNPYLKDGEFLPRTIELDSLGYKFPTTFLTRNSKGNQMRVISDQMDIGQNFRVDGVVTNKDLEEITIQNSFQHRNIHAIRPTMAT
ncbi:hypothetical protein N7457_006274 [Penicillium paradoxum]|uniref:uncharacterized protein n=1 Tax=Penicillium paradoxum TaxID=176176 RepID=UPI002549A0C6|nr:uncharacterized protein N7457_006274 [Penicillium paradoxum]KAJ5781114.1 hypothetical protein N7457_006274 [Penicillium paradoxum]